MGSIGHKSALALGLRIHHAEQAVEGSHQRPDFLRRTALVDAVQIPRRAPLHRQNQIAQGPQGALHRPADAQPHHRNQEQIRQQHLHQNLLQPALARVGRIGHFHDHVARHAGHALHHHAVVDALDLLVEKLRLLRQRHHRRQLVVPMQQLALGRIDLVRHQAFALLQEFFHRRRQQQHRRITRMRPHGNDGIGQQWYQAEQLLVLLAGRVVRGTIVHVAVQQRQQGQRHDQHQQQAALDADGVDAVDQG